MSHPSADFSELNGRVVLVTSAQDRHNPPAGRRGNLEVIKRASDGKTEVRVVVDFPDMFTSAAHLRIIPLNDLQLSELLASERNGTYEFLLPAELS